MNMVDDATSTTCRRLGEQETIWSALGVLRCWIGKYIHGAKAMSRE
jgi:hypothetical protein